MFVVNAVCRHNNGHLSRNKFRQALTVAELHCSDAEMQAIEARFSNDMGVNYFAFLEAIDPEPLVPFMYFKRLKDLRATNDRPRMPEREPGQNLDDVLLKVKTKVCALAALLKLDRLLHVKHS